RAPSAAVPARARCERVTAQNVSENVAEFCKRAPGFRLHRGDVMKKLMALVVLLAWAATSSAQEIDVSKRLDGFDEYMAKVLKDWNGPGIGVGIVVGDRL